MVPGAARSVTRRVNVFCQEFQPLELNQNTPPFGSSPRREIWEIKRIQIRGEKLCRSPSSGHSLKRFTTTFFKEFSVTTTTKHDHSEFCCALYVSFELGDRYWKLSLTTGLGKAPSVKNVVAGDLTAVAAAIEAAKKKLRLPPDVTVVTCYEAGRDGFWIHRALLALGYENYVVDSASIEVNRRKRRAKNDNKDARKLMKMLIRFKLGEKDLWKVVQPPSVEQEDARHLHRGLQTVQADKQALSNRMESLLVTLGVRLKVNRRFLERLEAARQFDGTPLPNGLKRRLQLDFELWQVMERQVTEMRRQVRNSAKQEAQQEQPMQNLLSMRGVGPLGAWILLREGLAWRQFKNRRQVAGFVGLTPTPYDSGNTKREQGISKAGNARLRRLVVELAWSWLHYQPDSGLTKWYYERFAKAGGRGRKVGIVALARKLLIALWRMATTGEIPDGTLIIDWETKFKQPPRTKQPAAA
jgi:transposase